ncbi:hypothetical protein [Catenuloplanes atrovinosus]|uniref:Uncharacterized protein n=1 Tax=Catenuloplanes atrovinosus TaxID=137266 RepID=A0AAE3YIU0_9ACTN|nr:hypothetical protein [Catenuloplanes atrovinosus]MDR7273712.1 hypothetical protein [Catenuloplanes atrovinosus]
MAFRRAAATLPRHRGTGGRWLAAAVVAVLGIGPAGCGGEPAPEPSASAAPPVCTPEGGTVDWSEPRSTPSLLHVVARFRDESITTWRDLLDRPFTPEVTGDETDPTWIPPLARSLGELRNLNLGETASPADELAELHTMLEGSTTPGWVLGYTGTTIVEAPFRVSCGSADPTPITGTLTTWHSLDSGFLSCTDEAARDDPTTYPDIWTYCPTT